MSERHLDTLTGEMVLGRAAAAAEPQILPGPAGPGLIFRGLSIHHHEDPLSEARNWVGLALSRRKRLGDPPKMALVFGLGLGWHVRTLMEAFPGIKVAVFEPCKSLDDVYEKYNVLAMNQEPEIYHDMGRFESMVASDVVHGEAGLPVVVAVPGYQKLFPMEAARFSEKVGMEISRREVIEKTKEITSSAVMENLGKNAGLAPIYPDLMVLKDRFPKRPAIIVGAGPSLAKNGRLLSEAKDRAVILCAAAALKPMLSMGARPDVVLVVESSDTSAYLRLTDSERAFLGGDCVLAAASSSHPGHFQVEGYHKGLFHLGGGEAQLLGRGLFLPQGGNAGSAAFALAFLWGLNPLILTGQDQAYDGAMLHAPGTLDSVFEDDPSGVLDVPAIGGGMITTNTSLLASINWYVEAALTIGRKPNPPLLINATAKGASIRGFAEMDLAEVIERLGPTPPAISLAKLMAAIPKPTAKEIRGDLKQMSGIVSSLKRLLQSDFHRCLAEMVNISRTSAFMAQILAPAMASGHKSGALRNLIWADGIILKMLSSL